jgi:hypothetical protein
MPEIRLKRLLPVLALGLCLAWPSSAVIIDLGDGTGNTSAPGDDPGWANVGTTTTGGLTAIYLGYGWILTAHHVGLGDVVLEGDTYEAVVGSYVRLENDTGPPPDLGVFRIDPKPSLPVLPIRASTPSTSTDVVMIGNGRNRGSATSWDPPGPLGPYDGYEWGGGRSMRWGTNVVAGSGTAGYTEAFSTSFTDTDGTTDEAQGANGDSGGPVFIKNGSVWELAGVMFAVAEYENQPAGLALYGNLTYAADLASYRDQIIELTRPQCSDEIDNDGDELIDYPSDPGCFSAADPSERLAGLPALSPWGLALLVGLLAGTSVWMAGRRRLGSL